MSKLTRFSQLTPLPAESSWFKPYRLFPGVTAIFEPYHFQEVISYLIEGEDAALLLDSGMGLGNMKAMVEALTEKPIILVNSHSHFDHVGDNWRFTETHLLDRPEYIQRLEDGNVFQADSENRKPQALWYSGPVWFDLNTWITKPSCRVVPIRDGHVFHLGGRHLRVLATEGHTKDSIMLADDEHKLLFTGDTVYPAALYAYIEGPEMILVYARTISQLAKHFSGYTLLCSHNNPIWEGTALHEIDKAFQEVLSGTAKVQPDPVSDRDERVVCPFGDFSIVLQRNALKDLGIALY